MNFLHDYSDSIKQYNDLKQQIEDGQITLEKQIKMETLLPYIHSIENKKFIHTKQSELISTDNISEANLAPNTTPSPLNQKQKNHPKN